MVKEETSGKDPRATGGPVCDLPHPRVNKTKQHTCFPEDTGQLANIVKCTSGRGLAKRIEKFPGSNEKNVSVCVC